MEVHPGVFVSNVATEEWQADPEIGGVPRSMCSSIPEPCERGCHGSRRMLINNPRPGSCPPPRCSSCLEVRHRVEIEDGPVLELKAGDMACLPKGAATTWHLTLPFKEMWVLAG